MIFPLVLSTRMLKLCMAEHISNIYIFGTSEAYCSKLLFLDLLFYNKAGHRCRQRQLSAFPRWDVLPLNLALTVAIMANTRA